MDKYDKIRLIGASIGLLICIAMIIVTNKVSNKINAENTTRIRGAMMIMMETGYVQGQLDASKGTMRIRMINDSTAVWVSSPWGNVKPCQDTVKNLNILH